MFQYGKYETVTDAVMNFIVFLHIAIMIRYCLLYARANGSYCTLRKCVFRPVSCFVSLSFIFLRLPWSYRDVPLRLQVRSTVFLASKNLFSMFVISGFHSAIKGCDTTQCNFRSNKTEYCKGKSIARLLAERL